VHIYWYATSLIHMFDDLRDKCSKTLFTDDLPFNSTLILKMSMGNDCVKKDIVSRRACEMTKVHSSQMRTMQWCHVSLTIVR